jgi:hypothetical protein
LAPGTGDVNAHLALTGGSSDRDAAF